MSVSDVIVPKNGSKLEKVPNDYGYDASNYITGENNVVRQSFQFFVHPPSPPEPHQYPRSSQQLAYSYNPTCGDKGKYYAYSVSEEDVTIPGSTRSIYLPVSHEIMPVLLVRLHEGAATGVAAVHGAGIRAEARVNRTRIIHTVCGNWVWSKSGYYPFQFPVVDDASVRVLYYVRRYTGPREDPVRLENVREILFDVNNTVLVDDHDVEVYVGVVADWRRRVIDVEVDQFVANRNNYEQALSESLTGTFDGLQDLNYLTNYDYSYTEDYLGYYTDYGDIF